MNKILTMVAAALVSAAAFGAFSWATVGSEAYDNDPNPSQAGAASYKGYLCTVETAQRLLGGGTVAAVTDYLANNFAAGSSTLKSLAGQGTTEAKLAGGAAALDAIEYERGQYNFTTYFANGAEGNLVADADYLGILLYGSGDDLAVRVFLATASDLTWRADDSSARGAGTAGDWTAAVPEPTSGILLLVGIAGLALRRRRCG